MSKISAFSIFLICHLLLSCGKESQTISVAIDDIYLTLELPLSYAKEDAVSTENGIVPYAAFFRDSINTSEFGVFKGPPLNFTEEDLTFYTNYIETQYGSTYELLNSKYGTSACCAYFLFLQKSSEHDRYREFYLVSPHGKKVSVGFEAAFMDPEYSIEAIVAGVEMN